MSVKNKQEDRITVSMSRKLNLQAYGGNPYESLDIFTSVSMDVDDNHTWQDAFKEAIHECETAMSVKIKEITENSDE